MYTSDELTEKVKDIESGMDDDYFQMDIHGDYSKLPIVCTGLGYSLDGKGIVDGITDTAHDVSPTYGGADIFMKKIRTGRISHPLSKGDIVLVPVKVAEYLLSKQTWSLQIVQMPEQLFAQIKKDIAWREYPLNFHILKLTCHRATLNDDQLKLVRDHYIERARKYATEYKNESSRVQKMVDSKLGNSELAVEVVTLKQQMAEMKKLLEAQKELIEKQNKPKKKKKRTEDIITSGELSGTA